MTGRRTPSGLAMGEAARLGDEIVAADVLGLVLGEPPRTVGPEGLLVGDADEQEVAFGTESLVREVAHRDGHRRREVQHVDRAPSPYLAVDDLSAERVVLPVLAVGGDDIGVPEKGQRGGVGVSPFDFGHQRGASGRGSNSSMSIPRPSNRSRRTAALRCSWPESGAPSLTQALRIMAWRSSATSPPRSPAMTRSYGEPRARRNGPGLRVGQIAVAGWLTGRTWPPPTPSWTDRTSPPRVARSEPGPARRRCARNSRPNSRKEVIVVVDATFGHRIDPSERKAFDEAVAHAELVSPPAGAVGRGDAFCCGWPSGWVPRCCRTTRSRSSTPSTPGSSTRTD